MSKTVEVFFDFKSPGKMTRLKSNEAGKSAILAPALSEEPIQLRRVWIARDKASDAWLIRFTAGLVLFVALRLLWRAFAGG